MDSRVCVGCLACANACQEHSGAPEGCNPRRTVVSYAFEGGASRFVSLACMHCAEPACLSVCPASALSKVEGGAVVVDRERCIGCRYCRQACPFDIPQYADGLMDKCDMCTGAGVPKGADQWCVQACPSEALGFGPLDELRERAGDAARQVEAPTVPSLIVS